MNVSLFELKIKTNKPEYNLCNCAHIKTFHQQTLQLLPGT